MGASRQIGRPEREASAYMVFLAYVIWICAFALIFVVVVHLMRTGYTPPWRHAAPPSPQTQAVPTSTAGTPGAPSLPPAAPTSSADEAAANAALDAPAKDGPIICIDPGHPSEVNAGTTVQHDLREVEVTYDVAQLVKETLEDEAHARVIMTRDFRSYDGRVVTNKRRAEIANGAKADLLLRLHCDTGKGSGFTIYYPDRQVTKSGKTGPSARVRATSADYALKLHAGMLEVFDGVLHDNGVKGESATYIGQKQGALTGSIYSNVPVLTVEMVFLSDRKDAEFIASEDGRQQMADALALGVGRCFADDEDSDK